MFRAEPRQIPSIPQQRQTARPKPLNSRPRQSLDLLFVLFDKITSYISFEKDIYISSLEMASPGNSTVPITSTHIRSTAAAATTTTVGWLTDLDQQSEEVVVQRR